MSSPTETASDPASDRLDGIEEIASFLEIDERKARYARETGSLPIRHKPGFGIYAFKSELLDALKGPETLPPKAA